jgi:segregation and condensation protein A
MPTAEYTVRLDAFEGPLDLLLFLIRRAEVEVTDIPIAMITRQYMSYLDQIMSDQGAGGVDIEDAGEFLVMAATLMEIKSRMLAPVPEGQTEVGDEASGAGAKPAVDPRAELVRQLLEYKRFRDAAGKLDTLKREWEDRYGAGKAHAPEAPKDEALADEEAKVDVGDLTLIDLVEAFSRIIETVDMSRVGAHRVVMDDTPVELHAEDLLDRLTRRLSEPLLPTHEYTIGLSAGEMDFREVFQGRTRSEAIGLFLAVLELVKQQRVGLRQDSGGRIVLGLRQSDEQSSAHDTTSNVVDQVNET